MEKGLILENVSVDRGDTQILHGLSFALQPGEVTVLTGQNGAGKSTLALALMGHPACRISAGSARFFGEDISLLPAFERARRGIFLAHQEPPAISGVSVIDVLRAAVEAQEGTDFSYPRFMERLRAVLAELSLDYAFAKREMHAQFSGGEKKRIELLSLCLLAPRLAILDELDSGMDEEARKLLLAAITRQCENESAVLVISHHPDFLEALPERKTHALRDGILL